MSAKRWAIAVVLGIALLLLLGRAIATVYADYLWFQALGAGSVWRTKVANVILLTGTSGVVASLFVFANLLAVRRSVVSLVLPRRLANLEIGEEVPGKYLLAGVTVCSVLLGALLAMPRGHWTTLALARFGVPFNETDPYLEADLGFFVYALPLENAIYLWALIAVLLVTAVVVFFYALTPSLRWESGRIYVSNYVRRHFVALGALLLLILSWSYRLDAYETLVSGSGAEGAFTFSDHYAGIRVNSWLWLMTSGAALVVFWLGWVGQMRAAGGVVVALLLAALLLRQTAPPIVRRFAPVQSASARERPYLAIRADYSRLAYGLNRLSPPDTTLSFESLQQAAGSISAWDAGAIERAFNRMRGSPSVVQAIGWLPAPAGLVATVALGTPTEGERREADRWSVTRIVAGASDDRGNPIEVPAPFARPMLGSELPKVLVHPGARGYRMVSDSARGIVGTELRSRVSRLAHAWSLQNFRLLGGPPGREPSRIILRTDLRERLHSLTPFFTQGTTTLPLVLDDGQGGDPVLYWVVDLYSAASSYPLSQRVLLGTREHSYVQHAATAIVNAHTGRVQIVADSVLDPIAESWVHALPDLFTARSQVGALIGTVLPPAGDAARVQALILSRYGLRGEPPRGGHLPWTDGADSVLAKGAAPPIMLRTVPPVLAHAEPVLDANDRIVGIVLALGGLSHTTFWMPLAGEGRADGARWSALLDQLRRHVDTLNIVAREALEVNGKVRSVPVVGGVAVVQPTYAWRPDAPPTLARVTVLNRDTVFSGRSLAAAVGSTDAESLDALGPLTPQAFRARVSSLYDEMRRSLQRGDLAGFARAYQLLGELIARNER
ncbi:MAG: UPF0182 family protein [Gemmatimonadaceae bacterium]